MTTPEIHVYAGAGNPDNIRGLVVRPGVENIRDRTVVLKQVLGFFETGEHPSAATRDYW